MKHPYRKYAALACLLLSAFSLTGCDTPGAFLPESTLPPGQRVVLPEAELPESAQARDRATLYFRFQNEPYLAAETRIITQLTGQSFEHALLEALFAGPGTQISELRSLFPSSVQVLSVLRQGRVLLVSVSREFLNQLPDEPVDWQEEDWWRQEMPLRRRLAMQSIVATVTENCDVDEVLILVQQQDQSSSSLRLKQNWFLDDSEDQVLTGPQTRDESVLLGPERTVEAILGHWLRRDWQSLYAYLIESDSSDMQSRISYRDFVSRMEKLPAVLSAACAGCTVSLDGQRATATVSFSLRGEDGQTRPLPGRVLHLERVSSIWKIDLQQLVGWLEEGT